MLPHVTALNLNAPMKLSQASIQQHPDIDIIQQLTFIPPISSVTSTSHYYTWLESDHPYKPATVSYYRVTFPEGVKWVTVEFTPDCGTAQSEDYLQLYIPNIQCTALK